MIKLPHGYKLKSYSVTPNDKIQLLYAGLAAAKKDVDAPEKFSFFIESKEKTIAGMAGIILNEELYVALLWVDSAFRKQKIGSGLMQEAENLARAKKCRFMTVNTFDFQALDFYRKIGFKTEFKRTGYPKNAAMHFLRKNL